MPREGVIQVRVRDLRRGDYLPGSGDTVEVVSPARASNERVVHLVGRPVRTWKASTTIWVERKEQHG